MSKKNIWDDSKCNRQSIIQAEDYSICAERLNGVMIPYEEYNKNKYDEDDLYEKLPVPAIVAIIVLCSLIGIFIVCGAIYGF